MVVNACGRPWSGTRAVTSLARILTVSKLILYAQSHSPYGATSSFAKEPRKDLRNFPTNVFPAAVSTSRCRDIRRGDRRG